MSEKYRLLICKVMRVVVFTTGILAGFSVFGWEVKPRAPEDRVVDFPIAYESNARGDRAEVNRNEDDEIKLKVLLAAGFIQYSPNSCPTLQIDSRTPVHHNEIGKDCAVETHTVSISLGDIIDNQIISLPLHRLMNGSQLAVRFVTSSGEYRESKFSLRNSKQAITASIGTDVEVTPSIEQTSTP